MDFTQYWFMLPVAVLVATSAMLSGIGGAALFTPIFLILFPLLGPEYPLASPVVAIGAALFTQTFGFSSGFVGYQRRGLIDFRIARPYLAISLPLAVIGALLAHRVPAPVLQGIYGTLVLILAPILVFHRGSSGDITAVPARQSPTPMRELVARDGTVYRYRPGQQGLGAFATALGAFLTGIVSVGIGEVVMPQLAKRHRIPLAVAAGTSVWVVILTAAAASITHVWELVAKGGLQSVPWNLVCYTVPGVILGGQIGPRLQGWVPQRRLEWAIGLLFTAIGLAMLWIALRSVLHR